MREHGGKETREIEEGSDVQDPLMSEPISTCTNSPSRYETLETLIEEISPSYSPLGCQT